MVKLASDLGCSAQLATSIFDKETTRFLTVRSHCVRLGQNQTVRVGKHGHGLLPRQLQRSCDDIAERFEPHDDSLFRVPFEDVERVR